MLSQADAVIAVQRRLALLTPLPDGDNWVVFPEHTTAHGFGWVIFYGSRLLRETGQCEHTAAGNAPLIVNRYTGEIVAAGTARPIEYYIAQYQADHANFGA